MNSMPSIPSRSENTEPVLPQGAPSSTGKHVDKMDLYRKLFPAVENQVLHSKKISGVKATPLDRGGQRDLIEKIVQLAVDSGITAEEMEGLINNGDLDLQSFIDRDSLIDTYRKNVTEALQNAGAKGISRDTILKLVSAAFKTGVMQTKGAVVSTPSGDFIVRLKKGEGKVIAISTSEMKKIGRGAYSTAYATDNLFDSIEGAVPFVLKAAEPKNVEKMQGALDGQLQERLVLKEIHAGGRKLGVVPAPHAVIGIISGNGGEAVKSVEKMKSGILVPKYDLGELPSVINKWNEDSVNGNDHFQERMEMSLRLLDGLTAIHAAGRSHGDIKPNNILCKTENDEVVADIADFDTSLSLSEIEEKLNDPRFKNMPWGKFTMQYVFFDDILKELDAASNDNADELLDIQKSRDVLAMGITIFNLITGLNEIEVFERKEINGGVFVDLTNSDYEKFIIDIFHDPIKNETPEIANKLIDLLNGMFNLENTERYTAEEARDELESIISSIWF